MDDTAGGKTTCALHITERPIESLTPYQRNPRTHSDKQIDQIAASIETFGFVNPVLIDATNTVIAGHGRLRAAKQLGMATVPTIRLGHLSESQARALVIADNKLAELAGWDEDLLTLELQSLTELAAESDLDFDMSVIGFDDAELERLLQTEKDGATDDDDIPSDVEKRCEAGDLWQLGDHRLLCGDATNAEDVARLLDGEKPQLCVTDPPYGVNYDPAWRAEAAAKGLLIFSPTRVGNVENDDRADWREAWALFGGSVIYSWSAVGPLSIVAGMALLDSGFEIRTQIIWRKPHFPLSRGHYTYQHEPCWYAVKKGSKAYWIGDASSSTVWEVSLDKNVEGGHSTQKPVELFTRAIANHQGDVYEPFCGSGTGVIAAEKLDRRCFAMEISPAYCDVILQRWERFTEGKAELVEEETSNGQGTDEAA